MKSMMKSAFKAMLNRMLKVYGITSGLEGIVARDRYERLAREAHELAEGLMATPQSRVKRRLAAIGFPKDRAHLCVGRVEETVAGDDLPEKVCFAYLDFDFYSGTKTALEFLHNRLLVRCHLVVDDYGFFSDGCKTAVDEFVARHVDLYELTLPLEFAGKFCLLHRVA